MRKIPRIAVAGLITLYQRTLSPDHGWRKHRYPYGYCRHEPTCSKFGRQVVLDEGVLKGSFKIARRLLNCHPWKQPSEEKIKKAIEASV